MLKKLQSTRLHLVILAISLLITTTVMGLSAFLHTDDDFSTSFTVVSKDDFKISITGQKYNDQVIFAGSSLDISPTVTHQGEYDCYLFAVVDVDEDVFEFDHGFNGSEWTLLDGTTNVYYYGTDAGLKKFTFEDSSTFFDSVTVRDDISFSGSAQIGITVYAIQTINYDATNPAAVWADAYTGV